MGTYKGNVGSLMQHWTLCKLLSVARQQHVAGLHYIDAHAMAPWANHRTGHSLEFDCVRDGLPRQGSDYEQAWHDISDVHQAEGYPSSAAFVCELWEGPRSLLLCENDEHTANEIEIWLRDIQVRHGCVDPPLHRGDFRDRFAYPFPNPRDAGLSDNALTLLSFDPDKYDMDPVEPGSRDLYPGDLVQALQALENIDGEVLMQISTYSRGNENQNPQGAAISSINSILAGDGFVLAALVWANGDMMSMVYARHVEWADILSGLQQEFDVWRLQCRP